jgi:hypothetical protein
LISKGRAQSDGSNVDANYFLGLDPDSTNTNFRVVADFEDMATGLNHPVFNSTGTSIPLNQWTHIAATYDGNEWRTYVNGNLDIAPVSGGGATPRFDSIQRFAIGSALDSTGGTGGSFRLHGRGSRLGRSSHPGQDPCLDDDEVLAAPNLIGHWGLNGERRFLSCELWNGRLQREPCARRIAYWGTGFRGSLGFTGEHPDLQGGTGRDLSRLPEHRVATEHLYPRDVVPAHRNRGRDHDVCGCGGGLQNAVALIAKGRGDAENDETRDINYFLGIELVGGLPKLAVDFEEAASTATRA